MKGTRNIVSAIEMHDFIAECIELCRKAVFKAAKKIKKKESFDDITEYLEALGEAKFPQKYRKEMVKLIDNFGTKVGAEDKPEVEDLNKIADIPSELVSTIQLGSWILETLPDKLKDSNVCDACIEMFSGF